MRWFVGLPVPPSVAHELVDRASHARVPLEKARLATAEDLHLTLRFFGELTESRIAGVISALTPIRQESFPVELTGVGAFRSVGAIYAAVAPSNGLDLLAEAVNEALAWRGVPRELRPFHPHVTLARVRRAMPQVELERWSKTWQPISFVADRLALFHSRDLPPARTNSPPEILGNAQKRYTIAQTFHFSQLPASDTENF